VSGAVTRERPVGAPYQQSCHGAAREIPHRFAAGIDGQLTLLFCPQGSQNNNPVPTTTKICDIKTSKAE